MRSLNINIMIHLAATFERSIESEDFYYDNFLNNIKLSNHLLGLVKSSDTIERFLFASSYLVYDSEQYIFEGPMKISSKLNNLSKISPRNLIGASKFYIENEIKFLQQFSNRCTFVTPRIYRGFGLGSRDVISRWVRDALKGVELEAYDLDGKFDYIYCKDSATAIYKLACESQFEGILDLGSGRSESIRKILETITEIIPKSSIKYRDTSNKIESSQSDNSRIYNEIKWKPKYSMYSAIKEIVEYEKEVSGINER